MPIRPPGFDRVAAALEPVLRGLPGLLISIDGRDGSGKTTLGRFLAWHFNITLVETDLFINDGDYEVAMIRSIIDRRLKIPRPIIVEGIAIQELLKRIGRNDDYSIYLMNTSFAGSPSLSEKLVAYETKYAPKSNSTLMLELGHE